MAHLEGFSNRTIVKKMLAHYERSFECEKENIDESRTILNKNYAPSRKGGQEEYLDSLLEEILTIKSTTNVLSDWIVTLPRNKELDDREDEFFQATYDWFVKTLPEGERSIVSAYVHYDESQPHLHIAFCPITTTEVTHNTKTPQYWTKKDELKNPVHKAGEVKKDKKGNIRYVRETSLDELGNPIKKTTLSQTGIFTRARLKSFHSDLEESLCKSLKMDFVGIVLDENNLLGKALSFVPHEHLELVNEHFKDKEYQLQEQDKMQTLKKQQLQEYAKSLDKLKHEQDKRDIEFIKEQSEILEAIELAQETTNSVKRMATVEEWSAGFTKAIPSFIPNPKVRDIVKSCIEKYISFVNRDVIKAISIAKEALFRKSKSREELSQEMFCRAEEIDKNQQAKEFQYKNRGLNR